MIRLVLDGRSPPILILPMLMLLWLISVTEAGPTMFCGCGGCGCIIIKAEGCFERSALVDYCWGRETGYCGTTNLRKLCASVSKGRTFGP